MILQAFQPEPPAFLADLAAHFSLAVAPRGERQWHVKAALSDAPLIAERLVQRHGAAFSSLVGTDERALGRAYGLFWILNLGREGYVFLESRLDEAHPSFASITAGVPAANWAEREVADLFGFLPFGHPDPRPLFLSGGWPSGAFPLRRDFVPGRARPAGPVELALTPVEGEGVHEVPVGPIHAGLIEPGHFRFSVDGEQILQLEAQLFWKHRGLEKHAEGRSFAEGLLLAERLCGACSFANALAYAQAVEALSGCRLPERAAFLRVIGAELERLYNHAGDMAGVFTDIAYATDAAHLLRVRERVLALNEAFAGHRLLMGLLTLGGVRRDLDAPLRQRLERELPKLAREVASLLDIGLHSATVLDRLETTGTVKPELAQKLALVGPAARAAGRRVDVRLDHPYAAYPLLAFDVPTRRQGDVLARLKIKAAEFAQSVTLIEQALQLLPDGPLRAPLGEAAPGEWACSATEGPRGENLHFVMAGPGGTLYRHKVRTSSYQNWPAVPLAALGNIVPDFPVINKSFNLCYACCDR